MVASNLAKHELLESRECMLEGGSHDSKRLYMHNATFVLYR